MNGHISYAWQVCVCVREYLPFIGNTEREPAGVSWMRVLNAYLLIIVYIVTDSSLLLLAADCAALASH